MKDQVKMSDKFLSIVTVVFNGGGTISRTFDSVRSIKEENIEYLVIDGKSSDNTLSEIIKNKDIIDKFISEPDEGIFDAMNKGINLSSGKYCIFINADDEIYVPGFVKAIEKLKTELPQVLSCLTMINSKFDGGIFFPYPRALPFQSSIPHPSTFVKTNILKSENFDTRFKISADYDLFLRLYLKGYKFTVLPQVTSLFSLGGASSNIPLGEKEVLNIRRERLGIKYGFYEFIARLKKLIAW